MSSRSLKMLRAALEESDRVSGDDIGDPMMERLFRGWTLQEKASLKSHLDSGALPQAMNDLFLDAAFSADAVRDHPLLGSYVVGLSDDQLSSIRQDMVRKKACVQRDAPPLSLEP